MGLPLAMRALLDAPVLVVTGHYGVGKTNLSLNLAFDAAARGRQVTVVDLDVVNPFFRSSDYRDLLGERGVRVIAPVFAGTNLDGPSLSGAIVPAIEQAQLSWLPTPASVCGPSDPAPVAELRQRHVVIIDAGGDDVGATALGRFANTVAAAPYELLYVVNRSRNLTQEPAEAVEVLREIEAKCRLSATAVANNTHLQGDTDAGVIERGIPFAEAVARLAGLPLAFTTVPAEAAGEDRRVADREKPHLGPNAEAVARYPVRVYVRTPWQ